MRFSPGRVKRSAFPIHGPFDERLGYTALRRFAERLVARGFVIERQARFSPRLLDYADNGYFVPYREKIRAGIEVCGLQGQPPVPLQLSTARLRVVRRRFRRWSCRACSSSRTAACSTPRSRTSTRPWTGAASGAQCMAQLARVIDTDLDAPGGSTLATQIEKYRHSPGGITHSPREKLRQMVSASVRAYREGPETMPRAPSAGARLPQLGAAVGGAGLRRSASASRDGLWVWYGADFERVNALLAAPEGEGELLAEQGQALRRVLSLMVAHRRPSFYLGERARTSSRDSPTAICACSPKPASSARRCATRRSSVRRNFATLSATPARVPAGAGKGSTAIRSRLAELLGVSLYELDRLDLRVSAHAGPHACSRPSASYLADLADPDFAREAGIIGERLLDAEPGRGRALQLHALRANARRQPRARADRHHRPAARHQRGQQARARLDREAARARDLSRARRRAAQALRRAADRGAAGDLGGRARTR